MKYEYRIHMEPAEFEALLRAGMHAVDAIVTVALSVSGRIRAEDDDEFVGTPVEAEAPAEPAVTEPPGPTLTLVPATPVAPAPTPEDRAKTLHGRDVWLALIEMWGENFGVEGTPQPDRAAILARILHMDGASVMAYLRSKQGLTDATRDVLCELRQRPLDKVIKRDARLLAENIAQVCSFHAPTITEMLEYSAEFHIIPE